MTDVGKRTTDSETMSPEEPRHQFFTLHELLIMVALAALGGVCSSALSNARAALHLVFPSPVGMQPLAGIHVLWCILALGLVRKPGAATVTGLLAGSVELLSGNPHGLLAVPLGLFAGAGADAVWILLGRRVRPIPLMLAGGVGAASNVVVFAVSASLSPEGAVGAGLLLLAGIAFVSGVVLAGLLGWWLLSALRRAGIDAGLRDPKTLGRVPREPPTKDDVPVPRRPVISSASWPLAECNSKTLALPLHSTTGSATPPDSVHDPRPAP